VHRSIFRTKSLIFLKTRFPTAIKRSMKLSLNLNDVNEIKPLTLYYDKINIVDDATTKFR